MMWFCFNCSDSQQKKSRAGIIVIVIVIVIIPLKSLAENKARWPRNDNNTAEGKEWRDLHGRTNRHIIETRHET